MDKIAEPQLGMRFSMHGADFEVSFVARDMVRYSSSAGGQVHRMPYTAFIELQEQQTIVLSNTPGTTLTAHNAQVIMRKRRYVEDAILGLAFPAAKAELAEVIKVIAAEISDTAPPSVRSVTYWIRAFRQNGISGLAPRRNLGNRTMRIGVEIEQLISEAIDNQFLRREWRRGNAVFAQVVGRAAELGYCDAHRNKMKLVSMRTIQRRLKLLDPFEVTRAQQGGLAASKAARAAGRSTKAAAILSIVQMDTHILDVLVIDPDTGEVIGHPYLTTVLDVNTRCIIGIYCSLFPASATTALAALKDMLVRYGIPALIIPDNGVEFANSAFILLCDTLAITISPAQVRDPDGKAHIESFFRTLTLALIQSLPGTTFSNPSKRGDYDSTKNARFTLQQVTSFTQEWINEVYHKTVHTRTMRAPCVAWDEQAKAMPPMKLSADEVNALARRPYQRTISGGRVQYAGLQYYSHAFPTLEAQGHSKVTLLVDELNLHTVFVEDPTKKGDLILAESIDPEYTSDLTQFAHDEAMAIKKAMSESDRNKFGGNANAIALWRLYSRIQSESQVAKKWLRKLTNGAGRIQVARQSQRRIENPSSAIEPEQVAHEVQALSPSRRSPPPNADHSAWQSIPKFDAYDVE
ncbi:DDE-type integrase/transposase/recombinase [Duganella sp.]|uniref:DDE-type integrase/transposase/recombinase n=1 Tax=Duganella sp. TaxID=1904440 RepID=UPI0031D3AD1B